MLGKKVADFKRRRHRRRPFKLSAITRAPRSSCISTRRTTRPAAPPRASNFATPIPSSARPGAIVVGISRDTLKSHENFKAKMANFPFELIADTDERLCAQFDVIKMKNMYGKQVRGIVRSRRS